ncbi:MAG: hypothetical protein JNJ45_08295 [Chthonomonas sp.]|nr:hypothetical protein [Chthonomonas sp.]
MKFAGLWAFFAMIVIIAGCGGGGGSSVTGGGSSGLTGNAEVTGQVVIDGTASGIPGVRVLFFDSVGILQAQGTTDANGAYRVVVSPSATAFFVDGSTVNSSIYYRSFYIGSLTYQYSLPACKPALPALTAGVSSGNARVDLPLRSDPPPPPPNGCN